MKKEHKEGYWIAVCALIVAFFVHYIDFKVTGRSSFMHETADDPSYLRPVENLISSGTWKDNTTGPSSYVQRPPLLGIIHGIFYLVSPSYSGIMLFVLALIVHALSVRVLFEWLKKQTRPSIARFTTWIYVLLPCFYGFLSYSISEVFEAPLVIFSLAVVFSEQRNRTSHAIALLCLLLLFRPVLVVLFPVYVYFFWKNRRSILPALRSLSGLVALLLLLGVGCWEIRKHEYTREWFDPHPIYASANQTQFRPVHAKLTQLFKIWESRPEKFHEFMGACWGHDSSFISKTALQPYITERNVPLTSSELHWILTQYSKLCVDVQAKFKSNFPTETTKEIRFCEQVEQIQKRLIKSHKAQQYLYTPLHGMNEQLLKSQLNLTVFQEQGRGNFFIEALRALCLIVILLSYLLSTLGIFVKDWTIRLLSFGVLCYFFTLFFVQVMNEDRYFIPVIILSFALSPIVCLKFYRKLQKKRF